MVLEHIWKKGWSQQKRWSFLLGFGAAAVGMLTARVLFPENLELMSAVFGALLALPTLAVLLAKEEKLTSFGQNSLFLRHKNIILVYICLFFGVFAFFTLAGLFSGSELLFTDQIVDFLPSFQFSYEGTFALSDLPWLFWFLFSHNLLVLSTLVLLSVAYGAGAVLFLFWNASVWGFLFGFALRDVLAALFLFGSSSSSVSSLSLLLSALPHLLLEAAAYCSAAIAGGIFSVALLQERFGSRRFRQVSRDALFLFLFSVGLLLLAALLEALAISAS